MTDATANNTLYYKSWNDDYRKGGIYYDLDNCELRTMVIMQAYVNKNGVLVNQSNKSYGRYELSDLIGIDYRTLIKAIESLETKGLITVMDDGIIKLTNFVHDNVVRDKSIQRKIARNNAKQQIEGIQSQLTDIKKSVAGNTTIVKPSKYAVVKEYVNE